MVDQSTFKTAFMSVSLRYWQQISNNAYYIVLPIITIALGAESHTMKLTVSTFFGGYAFISFAAGFLIAKFGMRKNLYASMIGFTIGTLVCIFAHSAWFLIIGRVLQAIGIGAVPVISKTLLANLPAEKRAQVFSYTRVSTMFATPLAMAGAGYLASFLSWQYVFVFMYVVALLGFSPVYFLGRHCFKQKASAQKLDFMSYTYFFRQWRFDLWVITYGLLISVFAVFFMGASFTMIHELHLRPHIVGLLTSGIAFIQVIGLSLSLQFVKTKGKLFTLYLGIVMMLIGGVLLFISSYWLPLNLYNLIWPTLIISIGQGVFYGPFNALIIDRFAEDKAHFVVSILATSIPLITMVCTTIAAFFSHESLKPIALLIVIMQILGMFALYISRYGDKKITQEG